MKSEKGFTLIELLIVIAIVGVLSTVVLASLNSARAKARDSARISNVKQVQTALSMYHSDYGSYPVSEGQDWAGNGADYGSLDTSGENGYIPNLAPTYIKELPIDPNQTDANGYIYKSDGNDYFFMAHGTAEKTVPIAFQRPSDPESNDIAIYTSGFADVTFEGGPWAVIPLDCGATSINGYGVVLAEDDRCWLDRNLGASQVAISYNDSAAYGDLYQWGRGADGHQSRTSSIIAGPVASINPGFSFITIINNIIYDWLSPQNNNLWQGVNGVNNPCPIGFRLPTQSEWDAIITASGITNYTTAYNSSLKLTEGGYRMVNSGSLTKIGISGCYWSSSPNGVNSSSMCFNSSSVYPTINSNRGNGFSVRCIKD
jgi:uncharacterized protein (TIGR02145 family)/prepilin-type N-terminal cleavage/methylation domain-containing protein